MPLSDLSPLSYFKELHLLPRVVFTIGGVLFFAGLPLKDLDITLFGVGLVFISLGYKLFAALVWNEANEPYTIHISAGNLFQGLLSATIAAFILYLAGYHYRYGVL